MNIKIDGKVLEVIHMYQQFLWRDMAHISPSYVHVYD